MKKILFVVAITFLYFSFTQTSLAGGFAEVQPIITEQDINFFLNGYVASPITATLRVYAFTLVGENWAQGYGGFVFAPVSWFSLGAAAGLEQAEQPWRVAGQIWLGSVKTSFLGIVEDGGSGFWYKALAKHQIFSGFSLGVFSQRFLGTGPYLEENFSLAKLPLTFWMAPASYDLENAAWTATAGLRFNL